jgi:putative DNA primase/helicase
VSKKHSVVEFCRTPTAGDDDIALRFSCQHCDDLRFTAAWGRWNHWNGSRWEQDDTRNTLDMVRRTCREVSSDCGDEDLGRHVASASTVAAVERLARADRRHAATVDQWDADPWLLNTPDGTVDLRTGVLRTASRDDYCTKITAVAPGGECPLWMRLLARVTDNSVEMQAFVQRMCGYSLTGITQEHALFFAYGTGANGKSVFINTISGLMGDYAKTAPMEAFTASGRDQHPTDLAGLQGARLVTASEVEDGKQWAESKLKRITGGDKIAARFMRQDFFEFTPQFKLIIAGNYKPGLRTVDEATRRRFNLLPFTVTIPKEERDEELAEKLHGEWGGILRWMIDGCLAWQEHGLNPPAVVRDATEDYLSAEDAIAIWLEERCDVGPEHTATVGDLYRSWCGWCEQNGETDCSQKRFSQNLVSRGFTRERSSGARGFRGLTVKTDYGL